MNFSCWSDALPYGLNIARAIARRCPRPIDVDSVVMEALWKAQTRGAVLSPAYVGMRVKGAIWDEMRRVAEGQRGNYQSAGSFVDVHEQWDLAGESSDPVETIDRQRALAGMSPGGLQLVGELVHGKSACEIARDLGVTAPRVSQVLAQLRSNPRSVIRLPGQVDLFEEIRREHRRMVKRAYAKTRTVTGVAVALGVSLSDASRWVNQPKLILPQKYRQFPELREKAIKLIRDAFVRANGSPMTASRLLTTQQSVAGALGREFAPDLVRSNRRPDITTDSVASLVRKGWSHARVAAQLGVGETTIARRARQGGIKTKLTARADLPDAAFVDLSRQGLRWREIAAQLGVSMATVGVRLARARKCAR